MPWSFFAASGTALFAGHQTCGLNGIPGRAAFSRLAATAGKSRCVEVKLLKRDEVHFLLARSRPCRLKERAIRRRQRRGLAKALKKLQVRVRAGRLKKRDKIACAVGHLRNASRKLGASSPSPSLTTMCHWSYVWNVVKFRAALVRDGASLCRAAIKPAGRHKSFGKPTSNQLSWRARLPCPQE